MRKSSAVSLKDGFEEAVYRGLPWATNPTDIHSNKKMIPYEHCNKCIMSKILSNLGDIYEDLKLKYRSIFGVLLLYYQIISHPKEIKN